MSVSFHHAEDAPASDKERRLREMGAPLVGVPLKEALLLLESLVVSTIGNTGDVERAEALLGAFCGRLSTHRVVVRDLAARVALKRTEPHGHA